MRSDLRTLLGTLFDRDFRRTMLDLHACLTESPGYRPTAMLRAGWAAIANDPLVKHDGQIVLNSFLPPLNSRSFRRIALDGVSGYGTPEYLANLISGKRRAPISTYLAVTGACPCTCWHCSASRFSKDGSRDLETAQLLHIVRGLLDLGVGIIGFTGGEPLQRDDLEELVSAASREATTFVFTSGIGLDEDRAAALKKAGLFGLAVSYDSTGPDAHDRKRGRPGAHAAARDALICSAAAGLYTMTQTVCTREMLATGELESIALDASRMGVHEMRIIEPLPCGSMIGSPEDMLSPDEREQLVDLHVKLNADRSVPKAAVFAYTESAAQFGCGAGLQHSYVDVEGRMHPCDFVDESFGSLLDEDPRAVWTRLHEKYPSPRCTCQARCPNSEREAPGFYRRLAGERVPSR
jgi:MoaA/NifB/PqqE/SkfB family radical SAM enzyme